MTTSNPSTLFLIQHSPIGQRNSRDAIEAILAFGAYEQQVGILFIGDGVYHLLPTVQSEKAGLKSITKLLSALALYDIDQIFVCQQSLIERGITADELLLGGKHCSGSELSTLTTQFKHSLSF